MIKITSTILAFSLVFLSGCKEEKSEAWYKQHPDETYTVYTECLKDGERSMNCEFAMRAAIGFAQIGKPGIKEKFETLFREKAKLQRQNNQ